jgi:NAD(P)-dependent dehydrogenase (short-subunit alcohol dehydrogenase family)
MDLGLGGKVALVSGGSKGMGRAVAEELGRGQSDIVDDEGIREMCRLIPQTELCEVADAGHMVVGDKNDAFNDGLFEFLHRHMPPADKS